VLPKEETDFPRPTRATSVKSIPACVLGGFSEVVVMQSVRHSHLVNLLSQAVEFLNNGFLNGLMRDSYKELVSERKSRLAL